MGNYAQEKNMNSLQEELFMNTMVNASMKNTSVVQTHTMPIPPAPQNDINEFLKELSGMTEHAETVDTNEQAVQKPVPLLPQADTEMMKQTIAAFQETDAVFEMRTIPNQGGKNLHCFVKNNADGIKMFFDEAEQKKLTEIPVYMTLHHITENVDKIKNLNHIMPSKGNDCIKDADVDRYRFIHIDCDPERKPNEQGTTVQADEAEVKSAERKSDEVKEFLKKKGWSEPIESFSGNGYTLDYAVDLEASKENKQLIKAVLKALSDKFSDESVKIDTSVHNAGRIIKLYGCISAKGKHTADRPYRATKVLHVPETRETVTTEQIQNIIDELTVKPEKKHSKKTKPAEPDNSKCVKISNVSAWLDDYNIAYDVTEEEYEGESTVKYVLEDCPFNEHDNHNCSALFQFENGNVIFNCFHDHCKKFTVQDMLIKYPLVNQIPLIQGKDKAIQVYNEVVSNCKLITAEDNQHYILTNKNEVVHFDSDEASDYIVTQAQHINQLPSKNMIGTIKTNISPLYGKYASRAAVAKRIAYQGNTLYYALNKNHFIKITDKEITAGNQLCDKLYFHYNASFIPQCEPDLETPASELPELVKQAFNISEEHMLAFLAQLVCFYMPHVKTPLLVLSGGQGTSKSTTSRKIKSLVDPAASDIQILPEKLDFLYTALSGNYLVAFDNIDKISNDYSAAFCVACTGGVNPRRKLFTDNNKIEIDLHTKIILNGIGDIISKNDLAERTNIIYLDTIMKRRTESQVWKEFNKLKPKMLGAIFNCIQKGLGCIEEIENSIAELPRMADFCVYGAAFIKAMGLDWKEFVKQYSGTIKQLIAEQTQQDDFTILLSTFLDERADKNRTFTGTAQELLDGLTKVSKRHHLPMGKFIPTTLSRALSQSEVSLNSVGITVKKSRGTKRIITLVKETETLHPATAEEVKKVQESKMIMHDALDDEPVEDVQTAIPKTIEELFNTDDDIEIVSD